MTTSWNLHVVHGGESLEFLRARAAMRADLLTKLCPEARGSYLTRQITNSIRSW